MELRPEKAYKVTVTEQITEIAPADRREFSLEEVQAHVDGFIEVLWLNSEQIMIINENGKFEKEYNMFATGIAHLHRAIRKDDYICGDVVICPSKMLP